MLTSRKMAWRNLVAMVNYRYDLSRISENHEAFANQQTVIAEKSVKTLAAEIEITDRAT